MIFVGVCAVYKHTLLTALQVTPKESNTVAAYVVCQESIVINKVRSLAQVQEDRTGHLAIAEG